MHHPERAAEMSNRDTHSQCTRCQVGTPTPPEPIFIEGLEVPVCIVGDSMFAGSMGGTPNARSYQQALQTATEHRADTATPIPFSARAMAL